MPIAGSRALVEGPSGGGAEMFGRSSLLFIVYLVIGVIVAASKDYFDNVDSLRGVISAALGIVLWPLLLLDVNLRIGRLDDDGRRRGLVLWLPALARSTKTILAGFKRPHSDI
jgi:hypothetical protein